MGVILLSGPVGSGKTTVTRELMALSPAPLASIEGDTFWSFIAKPAGRQRHEDFRMIMRSMTAAARPVARSGYEVILDFSIPPGFLEAARKILKEVRFDYVVLLPSLGVCETRASERAAGKIADYADYREFYGMFEEGPARYAIRDDNADPAMLARRIRDGINAGSYRVE